MPKISSQERWDKGTAWIIWTTELPPFTMVLSYTLGGDREKHLLVKGQGVVNGMFNKHWPQLPGSPIWPGGPSVPAPQGF